MFCKNCGAQIPDGSAFCGNCGTSMNEPVSQPNPQPVSQPAPQPEYREPVYQQQVYQQPSYQQPVYQQPPVYQQQPVVKTPGNPGKGMGVAALVMGIVSCCLFWIPYFNSLCLLMCIAGIILSAIGIKKSKSAGASVGLSVAGLVLSILGMIFSLISVITWIYAISSLYSYTSSNYWY